MPAPGGSAACGYYKQDDFEVFHRSYGGIIKKGGGGGGGEGEKGGVKNKHIQGAYSRNLGGARKKEGVGRRGGGGMTRWTKN